MVPSPSSIVTHAELQRLELLRHAAHDRLAAPASGRPLLIAVIPTLRRIAVPAMWTMLATLRLRPRCPSVRRLRREVVAGGGLAAWPPFTP